MELALYHPDLGYYAKRQQRVGYGGETDFYTASTSGPVFGELIATACTSLLSRRDPAEYDFVEIGTENGRSIMSGVTHPFRSASTISIGQEIRLGRKCVVFSNELFDAQPFHRFVFRQGDWRELGVVIENGNLQEIELAERTAPSPSADNFSEGYVVDAPYGSVALMQKIGKEPWSGLFVACDYGKSWRELIEVIPKGTARAYYRHQQSNELYARPGEQDLTCHVCWDWLEQTLKEERFDEVEVESQEAFLIGQAGKLIEKTMATEARNFSQKKLSLMQLIHPTHLGQKFQVLHALRNR